MPLKLEHPWPKGYYVVVRGRAIVGPSKSLKYIFGVRAGLLLAKRYKEVNIWKSLGPGVRLETNIT